MSGVSEKFKNISLGCFGCMGCIILLILLCGGLAFFGFMNTALESFHTEESAAKVSFKYDPDSLKEVYLAGTRKITSMTPRIAVIRVKGVMVSNPDGSFGNYCDSRLICTQIRRAATDPAVKGVILELDTPGGEVAAAEAVYQELVAFRSQTKKPLAAVMNSMAASGGYYIAAVCSPIVANRSTLTGSIGVIISTVNYSGLFTKLGLESETYTSGKMKDMLSGGRKRTPGEIAIVRSLVEESYSDFVKIVSTHRNIPEEVLRKGPAGDGRILSGRQALELKLVDQLGTMRDACYGIAKTLGLLGKPHCLITYEEGFDLTRMANLLFSGIQPLKFSLQGPAGSFIPRKGVLYYLPCGL